MSEERIGAHARAVEADVAPDPRYLDRLHDQLAEELGMPTRRVAGRAASRTPDARVVPRRQGGSRTRVLLLAATLVMAGAAAAVVGARLDRQPDDRMDLLTIVHDSNRLRIGIVAGYPQAQSPDGAWGGFDVDVASLLAEQLAVSGELVVSTGPDLEARPDGWDVAFPSLVTGPPDALRFRAPTPVFYWPVHVLVTRDDPAARVADVAGRRVCAVAGSAGAAWLGGESDVTSATPIVGRPDAVAIVPAADDAACLALLTAGEVDALVTSTIGPADLVVRPTVRAISGPIMTLPMAPIVSSAGPDPAALLDALDAQIERARSDGTLLDLSRRRFGADLITLPTP